MVERRCKICGKVFNIKPAHAKMGWGKYCSKKCQSQGQRNGRAYLCAYCGKELYRTPRDLRKSKSKRFFCSFSCHCSWENKHIRCGRNAPNWTSGENAYRQLLKRARVQEICRRCGIDDTRVLSVHHKDGNRRNNNIENLEWLCRNCHCIVHLK